MLYMFSIVENGNSEMAAVKHTFISNKKENPFL